MEVFSGTVILETSSLKGQQGGILQPQLRSGEDEGQPGEWEVLAQLPSTTRKLDSLSVGESWLDSLPFTFNLPGLADFR